MLTINTRPVVSMSCMAENTWSIVHVSAVYSAGQWAQLMGMAMMANRHYLRRLWTVPNNSKHIQAILSLVSTDRLRLRITQMPRCRRSGDFCGDNNNRQTD